MNLYIRSTHLTLLTVFITATFLQACSATQKVKEFKPTAAPTDKAAVYIYRPTSMSNVLYSPDLYVNNEFRLSLKNGNNTRLTLDQGKYNFEIEPEGKYEGKTSLSITVQKGQTYYIQVATSLKLNNTVNYQPYQRSFNLNKIETGIALQQITECCMKSDKNKITKSEDNLPDKTSEQGFSVDKTQNPFSH